MKPLKNHQKTTNEGQNQRITNKRIKEPPTKIPKYHQKGKEIYELLKPFVDPTIIKCPIIVIGTEKDKAFDLKIIKETANDYGVGFDIIGGASHSIMLDFTWKNAANIILKGSKKKL
ncbi:11916_t:CDS:2 [Funneliformis caledonium]|uniref:11916_t:CDS:1 n=1 Tax=Funneliformis caledonium TaxID=1117310 RepID=A0A9N9FKZ7_9GLOM|nr:11916_t:CDS:2 [Funneliformis caledonium]